MGWQDVFDNLMLGLPGVKIDALTVAFAMTFLLLLVMGLNIVQGMLGLRSEGGNFSSDDEWIKADKAIKKSDRADAARERVLWRNKDDDNND